MPPRKHRLRHKSDIESMYRYGRRIKIGDLFLFYRKKDTGHRRSAVIISKKFSLLATARNRQKRVILEALDSIKGHETSDIIVTYTRHGKMLSYKDVQKRLENALQSLT